MYFAVYLFSLFFFFNDTATTEIYTLSLHDALPISAAALQLHRSLAAVQLRQHPAKAGAGGSAVLNAATPAHRPGIADRKSTRLNSSHANISYAVFCLKKKKKTQTHKRSDELSQLST